MSKEELLKVQNKIKSRLCSRACKRASQLTSQEVRMKQAKMKSTANNDALDVPIYAGAAVPIPVASAVIDLTQSPPPKKPDQPKRKQRTAKSHSHIDPDYECDTKNKHDVIIVICIH